MKNINVNVHRPPVNIPLGRQGENLATCVTFDCTGLAQLYGDGTAELLHELKSGTVYPVAIQQDGASVSWAVSASDTATVGAGRAELRWYVGDTLAKSAKFRTSVSSALPDKNISTPPAPYQSWVDKVLKAAQEIKDGAISEEQLAAAIAAYLEEHPIDAGLDEAALAAYLTENGYLTDAALADAIAQALAEAKASGQFDGEPGAAGADGGYYAPSVDDDGNLTWTASAEDMPAVTGSNIRGTKGDDGISPTIGENGNWYLGDTDTGKPSRGEAGATPNIQIGSVETLEAGSDATASIGGTPENPMLNLGIPKGADGQPGADGKSAYQYAQEGGYTGTEAEFAAKLAEEMPDALPNPNALTFTGAVTGSYDGSAPLSVEIPSGGASGGGSAFSPQLIAKLVADGTTTSILQDIDVAYPGIYTVAIIGNAIADTENAGQYLFAKFGASNIYASAVDVRSIQTVNNNFSKQFVAVTFAIDSEKCFHVIGKAENNASNTSNWMATVDGTKILTNAIFFYSSSSKIIPAGFTCSVWRWA